jgi:hypothetical protein
MDPVIKSILGEDKPNYETRTYTIQARPDHLDKIEELFTWINHTRGGHSGGASIYVDGDGAARVTIKKKDGELKGYDKDEVHTSKGIEFSVSLE